MMGGVQTLDEYQSQTAHINSQNLVLASQGVSRATLVHIVLSAIVGLLLYLETGEPKLIIWVALVWGLSILRKVHANHTAKNRPSEGTLSSVELVATLLSLSLGIAWGALAPLTFFEIGSELRVVIAFVVGGIALGGIASTAYHLPLFFGLYLPMVLLVSFSFFLVGDRPSLAMGAMSLIFSVATGYFARRFNITLSQVLSLEREKDQLARQQEIDRNTLEMALSSRSDGFAVFDAEDRLTLWNERFESNLVSDIGQNLKPGVTFEDLVRMAWRHHAKTLDGADSPAWPSWRIEQHKNPQGPFEQRINDGWALINEFKTRDDQTVLIHTDITELKAREMALAESEAQKGGVLDTAMDAIILIDENDNIIEFNRAAQEMFGYAKDEVLGKRMSQMIIPPSLRERHFQGMMRYRETGQMKMVGRRQELVAMTKQGREIPVELSLSRVVSGERIVFASFMRDISQQLESQKTLMQAKEVAEAASRAKGEFLSMMSHEVRTPMHGMLTALDLLLESKLDADQRRLSNTAKQAGDALRDLLNDVIDYAKLDAGELYLEQVPFDLRSTVQNTADLFRPFAQGKGLEFGFRWSDRIPSYILGDGPRLRQILTKLLSNAIKYTAHGRVDLIADDKGKKNDERWLRISIVDTGEGIDPERHSALFSRSAEAVDDKNAQSGGIGLGLSIAQQLAHMMGGTITFETQLGAGSSFCLDIPIVPAQATDLAPAKPANPTIETPVSGDPFAGLMILLVDDSEVNRAVTGELLQRLGAKVEEADSGTAAIEAVDQSNFDVVLMDISMPVMDGITATKIIREKGGAFGRLPIIALTAHSGEDTIQQTRNAGMNGFVGKPIRRAELIEVVHNVTGKRVGRPSSDRLGLPVRSTSSGIAEFDGADVFLIDDGGYAGGQETTAAGLMIHNPEAFARLREDVGEDAVNMLIETYLKEAKTRYGDICAASKSGDSSKLEITAHALKSASRSFGADALGALCADLEIDGREKRLNDARNRLEELSRLYEKTDKALSRVLKSDLQQAG